MKSLDLIIREEIKAVAEDTGAAVNFEITEDSVLLETGLDSLGFAILVAKLEAVLGYDPFVLMETPFYPRTYGEFLGVYEKYAPKP